MDEPADGRTGTHTNLQMSKPADRRSGRQTDRRKKTLYLKTFMTGHISWTFKPYNIRDKHTL